MYDGTETSPGELKADLERGAPGPTGSALSALLSAEDSKRVADEMIRAIQEMETRFCLMCGHIETTIWGAQPNR